MRGNGLGLATIVTLAAVAALMVPMVAPTATGAPVPAAAAANGRSWAYGGEQWTNHSVNLPNATFSSNAYFGAQVVITETNTSNTTREIHGTLTQGASYFAQICRPSCPHAVGKANLSLVGWQQTNVFVNLTTNATVYEPNSNRTAWTAEPALGIENASSSAVGFLNESYSLVRASQVLAQGTLEVSRSASMEVDLSPALGIIPWNLTRGTEWNATSTFTAHGGWNDSFTYTNTAQGGTSNFSRNASGSVAHTGTESVHGHAVGNVTLRNGHSTFVVVLGFVGPFSWHDGVFLTTPHADLFGGLGMVWGSDAFASAGASTSGIDVAIHPGVRMATMEAASASADIGPSDAGTATLGTEATLGPSTPSSANESVQEQPESVSAAQQASQCLMTGCPSASAARAASGRLVLVLFVVAAAVAGVGAAVLLVRSGRRRPPNAGQPTPPRV